MPALWAGEHQEKHGVMGDSEKTGLCRKDGFVCVHVCLCTCACVYAASMPDDGPR